MWIELDQFLQYLTYERKYSQHTVESYRNDLRQFIDFLEKTHPGIPLNAEEIEAAHIKDFLGRLLYAGLTKRSIARKLSSIKSFFRYLKRCGKVEHNFSKIVTSPKLDRRLPVIIDIKRAMKLMELPPSDTYEGLRDRAILELFYGTGMRLNELLSLRIENIDFSSNTIRVTGKGKKERVLPLGS
ncbi:MAG: site-specific integrase, partial [Calditrichia bacterium]